MGTLDAIEKTNSIGPGPVLFFSLQTSLIYGRHPDYSTLDLLPIRLENLEKMTNFLRVLIK
jgi:hypothetical protein